MAQRHGGTEVLEAWHSGTAAQERRAGDGVVMGDEQTAPHEGSLAEIDTLLVVAQDLGYLSAATAAALQERRDMAAKVTFGLQRKMRARIPA